jgi:hypothetical protein
MMEIDKVANASSKLAHEIKLSTEAVTRYQGGKGAFNFLLCLLRRTFYILDNPSAFHAKMLGNKFA